MKKIIKTLFILILLTFFFRGQIYRITVKYEKIGERELVQPNQELINEIQKDIGKQKLSIEEIIELSKKITNRKLKFTGKKVSRDPNELIKTGKANCIGYSATFNSIGNYLLKQQKLEKKYELKHFVGKIKFLGIDVHQFFDSPFFKDHDYNVMQNLETNYKMAIDPTISDYLKIHRISPK